MKTERLRTAPNASWSSRHLLLVGKNGAGKSTALSAIKAAFTGTAIGGGSFEVYGVGGKPYVEVLQDDCVIGSYPNMLTVSPAVVDVKAILALSGPAKSAALTNLLNPEITPKDIEGALREALPAHEVADLMFLTRMEIDAGIEDVARRKRENDDEARSFGTVSEEIAVDINILEGQVRELRERISVPNVERRAKLVAMMRPIEERLGDKAGVDPLKVQSLLAEVNKRVEEANTNIRMEKDLAAPIEGILSTLEDSIRRLAGGTSLCPLCQSQINDSVLGKLTERRDEQKQKLGQIQTRIQALTTARNELLAKQTKASILNKDLSQLFDLRQEINSLPASVMTEEEIAKTKSRIEDLTAQLDAEKNRIRKSRRIAECQSRARVYRAAENALKSLKGEAVAAAGIPSSVSDIVHTTLGYRLDFAKVGRSWDLLVIDSELKKRSVQTLSSGEWQVMYAAFATLLPSAWVLIETAEIDTQNRLTLLTQLLKHPGVVIAADWSDRPAPSGYEKLSL